MKIDRHNFDIFCVTLCHNQSPKVLLKYVFFKLFDSAQKYSKFPGHNLFIFATKFKKTIKY